MKSRLFYRLAIVFAVLIILGIGLLISTVKQSVEIAKGTQDFNTMTASDFKKGMYVSGEVYYIFDQFAYYESTTTSYGIKVSSKITPYYVVPLMNENSEELQFIALAIGNDDVISMAENLMYQTWDYMDYDTEPEVWQQLNITGKVTELDGELLDYFYDYFMYDDETITKADVAPYICPYVITYCDTSSAPTIIVTSLGLIFIGAAGIIVMLLIYSKKKNADVPVNEADYNAQNAENEELMAQMSKLSQAANNADDFFASSSSGKQDSTDPEPAPTEAETPSYVFGGGENDMDSIDTSALGIGIGDDE